MRTRGHKRTKRYLWHLAVLIGVCAFASGGGLAWWLHQAEQQTDAVTESTTTREEMTATQTEETVTTTEDLQVVLEEKLVQYARQMTLDQQVGQLLFLHEQGEDTKTLQQYQPGGILLFGSFFQNKSAETVTKEIAAMQEAVETPMLVGVDEEGGTVVRVSRNKALADSKFQSPQTLYREGGLERIQEDTREKAQLLKKYGITVNFAPVADVSVTASDYIYRRTLGLGAEKTAEYVETVVEQMKSSGLGSVVKHFPGYGNNRDTHKGFATDNRSMETFETSDFLPFQAAIDAGVDSVLVSHNLVVCMDDTLPASLSPKVHALLREQLQFTGVIMTDDLVMDAIRKAKFDKAPSVLALLAGNDMVITTDFEGDLQAILEAVADGELAREQIEESVVRVLKWKYQLGILEVQ